MSVEDISPEMISSGDSDFLIVEMAKQQGMTVCICMIS